MDPFIRLNHTALIITPNIRRLKQADYQTLIQAEALLTVIQREADEQRVAAECEQVNHQQAGYEQGLTQARIEMAAQMLDTVERTVAYLGALEHRVVDLVMMAVRKVLGEFEEIDLTQRIVHQALQIIRNQPQATIRVCPAHAERLQQQLHDVLAGYHALRLVEVVSDPRLQQGNCILETEIGVVEASLEAQLSALERALRSRLQKRTDTDLPTA